MTWNQKSLSSLPVRDGFYMRGENMTRIEVFSDAAFAFAVTMLVISLSTIPQNYDELVQAMQRVPSFATSFSVIMVVWIAHRRWSRRFGLDDGLSTFLTCALIFVVLVYVYPLKLTMDLMFYGFSAQLFPTSWQVSTTTEVSGLVAIFSIGYFFVALIYFGLYRRAGSKADELCLNPLERLLVRKEQMVWLTQVAVSLVAALLALIFRSSIGYLAGVLFGVIPVAIPLAILRVRKDIKACEA